MESDTREFFSYGDLELYTNGFSEENFIGNFQFGRVYRGKIPQGFNGMENQEVMVKVYEDSLYQVYNSMNDTITMRADTFEICNSFPDPHPNLVKLIGVCCEEGKQVGAVFDFKPLNTVDSLLRDGSFTWVQRIKVALQIASLIEYFHFPKDCPEPYIIRNVNAAHIMLDENHNAKYFDLSMADSQCPGTTKNIVGELIGSYGYVDPSFSTVGATWSEKGDVFAFGVVLLGLITKKVIYDPENIKSFDKTCLHKWAHEKYRGKNKSVMQRFGKSIMRHIGKSKRSLVDHDFEEEEGFYSRDGSKITKLAMRCVNYCRLKRPTMEEVVDCLLDLDVIDEHEEELLPLVRGYHPDPYEPSLSEVIYDAYIRVKYHKRVQRIHRFYRNCVWQCKKCLPGRKVF